MIKKTTLLIGCLCFIFAGQTFAGNTEKTPVSKYVSKKRAAYLRSTDESTASSAQLRAFLEPGHKPDSAVVFDETGTPYDKIVYSYNADTITETIYHAGPGWGESPNKYYKKKEYAFDTYGNQILDCFLYYDDAGVITSGEKGELAFNPNGTPLYDKYYDWENGQWELYYEQTFEYDASGMLTGVQFIMEGTNYPVTVTGTVDNLVLSFFSGNTLFQKIVLHYNPETMKLMSSEYSEMDMDTGEWYKPWITNYTYDSNRRLLVEEDFEEGDSDRDKTEYTYNATGQKLSRTYSSLYGGKPYTIEYKIEYEYTDGKLVKTKEYSLNYNTDALELTGTTIFYYSNGTGTQQVTLTDVSVYPNPVTDMLTISNAPAGATLRMVDLSGRTILRQTLKGGQETLSVTSLPTGYYIATIQSNQGTATFKIIKK